LFMRRLIDLKLLLVAAVISGVVGMPVKAAFAKSVEGSLQEESEMASGNGGQDGNRSMTDGRGGGDGGLMDLRKPSGEAPLNETTPQLNRFYTKFVLLGTVVGDRGLSFAIIEDRELKSQRIYRIGHPIDGGIVTAILKDQVFVRFGANDAILKIGGSSGSTAPSGAAQTKETERQFVTLSLHGLRNVMEDLNQSGSQTRIVPNASGMGADGLRLINVDAESVLGTMGLKSGDVIEAINGKPIQDPYNAVAMFNLMKSVFPEDKFNEMGLDMAGFLDGINNHRLSLYQKVFSILQKNKNTQLTLTVKRKETK
jgi:type II secretory pathway component PulC